MEHDGSLLTVLGGGGVRLKLMSLVLEKLISEVLVGRFKKRSLLGH